MPNLMIVGISWEESTEQCRKIPSILIVDEAHLIYGKDKEASLSSNN
ncbi:9544_t:CDS:1, partial [Rhizophagus irregularis]